MMAAVLVLAYVVGAALGFIASSLLFPGNTLTAILVGGALGGLVSLAAGVGYWYTLPGAARSVVDAARSGVLIVAVGADKKLRLLPGRTDGFVIRPRVKPYSEKYAWAADGESAYPVHRGKGMQAIVTYMGYPFPLEVRKAAAISKFREKGFRSLEDLKAAVELPSPGEVEERIRELEGLRSTIESMSEEEVEKTYGAGKQQVLAEVDSELERLRRVRELVEKYGGGPSLTVNVDGATVRASDLISYLVWRHHPAELERIVKAETNAVLARMNAIDWIKQLMPVIIVAGMMVLAVLAAIYMLSHGGAPHPAHTIHIGGGVGGG